MDLENYLQFLETEECKLEDIFQPIFGRDRKKLFNVLHWAIQTTEDPDRAAEIIERIYKCALSKPFAGNFEDALFNFTNFKNSKKKSPIDIALKRKYFKVMEILLDNGADVSFGTKLREEYQNLKLKVYDRGLKLEGNPCDITDERWWTLEYDFQKIIGRQSQSDFNVELCETRQLAKTLCLSRERRTDLMLHPLVQLFVTEKYKKYSWLISLSICIHKIWSIMSATFIMCASSVITAKITTGLNPTNQSAANITSDAINMKSDVTNFCVFLRLATHEDFIFGKESGWFFRIFVVFFVFFLIKETCEWSHCPSKRYYWNQFENLGQWVTIGVIFVSWLSIVSPELILLFPVVLFYFCQCFILFSGIPPQLDFVPTRFCFDYLKFGVKCTTYVIGFKLYFASKLDLDRPVWFYFVLSVLNAANIVKSHDKNYLGVGRVTSTLGILNKCLKYGWYELKSLVSFLVIRVLLPLLFLNLLEQPLLISISSLVCYFGIAVSLFLIQGQLAKMGYNGVYTYMMIKGFKMMKSFLLTFFPILAAFFVLFNFLMPTNPNFRLKNWIVVAKIVTMQTGDLGFDDMFSEDNIQQMPYVAPAVIVMICFAVLVVLLLQNLLIGLTVNDLQKLRRKATAAHVASRLEVISLMEGFVMANLMLRLLKLTKLHNIVIEHLSIRNYGFVDPSPWLTHEHGSEDPERAEVNANESYSLTSSTVESIDASENFRLRYRFSPKSSNYRKFGRRAKFSQLPKSVREVLLENQTKYLKK